MLTLLIQALLGASIGEMAAGRKMGVRAMVLGAIVGLLPDLDRLLIPLYGQFSYIQFGQGPSHSLLVMALLMLVFPVIVQRIKPFASYSTGLIRRLIGWVWAMHIALDVCTLNGPKLFWPLWQAPQSLNLLPEGYIPLAIILGIFVGMGLWKHKQASVRNLWVGAGVMLCLLILTTAFTCRQWIKGQLTQQWKAKGSEVQRMGVMPTAGAPLLWLAVAELPFGYEVAYRSLLDAPGAKLVLNRYPKTHDLEGLEISWNTEQLLRAHSERFYLITNADSGLFWHDLRYGVLDVLRPDLLPKDYLLTYQMVQGDQEGKPEVIALHAEKIPNAASIRHLWRRMWGEPIANE